MNRTSLLLVSILVGCSKDDTPDGSEPTDTSDTGTGGELPVDADEDGVPVERDCDDADPTVFPGAPDQCGDDRVTDCDRTSDDGLVTVDGTVTFDALQEALGAAHDGSILVLCPGTWSGPFVSDVAVELVAHVDATVTVIDGVGAGTALSVPGDSAVVGLTIRGGRGTFGGGLAQTGPGALVVSRSVITGNRAGNGGGIALAEGSTATISDSDIFGNTALEGGGGLWGAPGATIDLTGSTVRENDAELFGGGVFLDDADLVGGRISDNTCRGYDIVAGTPVGGGGLAVLGDATVVGTVLATNRALLGGGFSVSTGAVVFTDVSVSDNRSDWAGGGFVGQSTVALEGTTEIVGNLGPDRAGGLMLVDSTLSGGRVTGNETQVDGGGLMMISSTLTGTIVDGNSAGHYGGGIFVERDGSITGGSVSSNTSVFGAGGIFFFGDVPLVAVVDGVSITDNQTELGGGGMLIFDADVTVRASTVLRNTSLEGEGGGAGLIVSTLASVGTDWGLGADDNVPSDVYTAEVEIGGYGPDATFECTPEGCAPEP